MTPKLAHEIYIIVLYQIISIVILVMTNFAIYLKARKNSLLYTYLLVQLTILIWLVSKVFKTVSPNVELRWFFIVTQYFGNCFLGSSFFIFAYRYAAGKMLNIKYIILFCIPSAFFFLSMATNPLHMLFYSYYYFYRDKFGPLFYYHSAYTYTLVLIGCVICSKDFIHQFKEKRILSLLFSIGILFPLIINIFYIFKVFKKIFGVSPLFDITPIACNLSLMMFAIATFKFRFFDIIPIARRKAFNQIGEGILLFDNNGDIIHFNRAFKPLKNEHISELNGNSLTDCKGLESVDSSLLTTARGASYKLKVHTLLSQKKKLGTLFRFIDVTNQHGVITSLTDKNKQLNILKSQLEEKANVIKKLSISNIQKYIAKEVHDILGHSIVLSISMLEVAKISLKKTPEQVNQQIGQVANILKKCLLELEASLMKETNPDPNEYTFVNTIHKLAEDTIAAGVNVEVTIQGSVYDLTSFESDCLYRFCQEGITNAIRHGKATTINIILRFLSYRLDIFIMDNGKGCDKIVKGYGLSGMEDRIINLLGGTLKYGSSKDSGFTLHATLNRQDNLIAEAN